MKKKFSHNWKTSKQARKQRKYRYNLPLYTRHKLMGVNLIKELRKKYLRRSFPIRKGDNVKIIKGKFKKKTGKIIKVDPKRHRCYVEGIQITKRDGSKINMPLQPSNLQIIELNLEDKKRIDALERKIKEKK